MVKKIAVAALMMAGNMLMAEGFNISASKKILGLEIGHTQVQGDIPFVSDYEGSGVDYGFRLGAQNEEWRTLLIYDHYDNTDEDQNVEKGFLTVDYFFMGDMMNETVSVNPYIGANVGYANYESTGIEDNGFLYGGQLGLTVGATENFEFDLGYRYSFSDVEHLDHLGSAVLGIHYNY